MKKFILLASVAVLCCGIVSESQANCDDPNCKQCAYGQCVNCKDGYVADYNSNCITAQEAFGENCESASGNIRNGCSKCKDGYVRTYSGQCSSVEDTFGDGCKSATADHQGSGCYECEEGTYWSQASYKCVSCPEGGCPSCPTGQEYRAGYSGASCMVCTSANCSKCTNTGNCAVCNKGYLHQSGGCRSEALGCGNGFIQKGEECVKESVGCDEGETLNNKKCICNKKGYKNVDGYCNRVIYTPAEVAPLLNDNDNFVVITFKK